MRLGPALLMFALLSACGKDDESADSALPDEELEAVVPGDIAVSPGYLEFGELPLGEEARQSFTITNEGAGALQVYDVAFDDDSRRAHYTLLGALSGQIEPGATAAIEVVLLPRDLSELGTNLQVRSDDPDEASVSIALRAVAIGVADVRLDPPGTLALGTAALGDTLFGDVNIANDGTDDLLISAVELIDPVPGTFSLLVDPTGSRLAPDAEDGLIRVGFGAAAPGDYSASIMIYTNDPIDPAVTLVVTARAE
jgi:hypothetical protein